MMLAFFFHPAGEILSAKLEGILIGAAIGAASMFITQFVRRRAQSR